MRLPRQNQCARRNALGFDLYNDDLNRVQIGNADDGDFIIRTNDAERFRVDKTTGNVGIGTNSPGEKLEVSGNIKISSSSNYLQASNIQNLISGGTFRIKSYAGTSLAEFQNDGDS